MSAAAPATATSPIVLTRLALIACGLSLAAALFALAYPRGCGACEAASQLGAGPLIPILGSLWYAALLTLLLRSGLTRLTALLAHFGVGVHLGLIGVMAQDRAWCIPCLVAAVSAILLAACAWKARVVPWQQALAVLIITGCVSVIGLYALSVKLNFKLQQELQRAVALARAHGPVAAGTVELTYFRRDGCLHCLAFERDVLPQLKQQFGDKLNVVRAEAWSGIPTVTAVIRGRHEALLYPEPSLSEVSGVVQGELSQ